VPAPLKIARRFRYEHDLLQSGVTQIVGVDEAGRGPLAGPVVAAALMFPTDWILAGLPKKLKKVNDSKQLTAAQREELFAELTSLPEIRYSVGQVDVRMIEQINILQATHRAMNLALAHFDPERIGDGPSPVDNDPGARMRTGRPHAVRLHALVDGLFVKTLCCPQTAMVDGDCLSYSIAAASIIAKVTRDRLMREFHRQFPIYGFADHKGYGTPEHLAALKQHGPCPIHRMTFYPLRPAQAELFAP